MTAAMESPTMASFTASEQTSGGNVSRNGEFISYIDQNTANSEQNGDFVDDPTSPSMQEDIDYEENDMVDQGPNIGNDAPPMVNKLRTRAERSFTERPTMLSPGSYEEDFLDMQIAMDSQFAEMTPMTTADKRRQSRLGKKYMKYTPEDRVAIGKHCFEKGPASARLAFKDKYPNMSESVTRGFREKYKAMIGEVAVFEFEQARREKRASASGVKRKQKNADGTDKDGLTESSDNATAENGTDIDPAFLPKKYNKYSPETRMRLGQICAEIGPSATVKRFRDEFPSINGSVVRSFRKKYLASQNHPRVYVLEDGEHANSLDKGMPSPDTHTSAPSMAQNPTSDHSPSMVTQTKRAHLSIPSMVKSGFEDSPSMAKATYEDSTPSMVRPTSDIKEAIPQPQPPPDDSLPTMSMVRSVREQPRVSYPAERNYDDYPHSTMIRVNENIRAYNIGESKHPRITTSLDEPFPSMVSPKEPRPTDSPVMINNGIPFVVKSESSHMIPSPHSKTTGNEVRLAPTVKSFKNETEYSMARKYEPFRSEPERKQHARTFHPTSDSSAHVKAGELKIANPNQPLQYMANGHDREVESMRGHQDHKPLVNGHHGSDRPYVISPEMIHNIRQSEVTNGQASPPGDMRKRVLDARLTDVSDRIDVKHRKIYDHSRSPVYERQRSPIYSDHRESPTYPFSSAPSPPYPSVHPKDPSKSNYFPREHPRMKDEQPFDEHRAKHEYHGVPSDIHDKSGQYPYYRASSEGSHPDNAAYSRRREKYQKYTPEDRYNIGKLCDQVGLAATVKVYRESFPRLNESVVRTFRNKYRELVAKSDGVSPESETIDRKPSKRSLVGSFESEVCMLLKQYKESGLAVSVNLALAVANQLIVQKGPEYVEKFGGKLELSQEWAYEMILKRRLNDGPLQAPTSSCCMRCGSGLVCPKCAVHV